MVLEKVKKKMRIQKIQKGGKCEKVLDERVYDKLLYSQIQTR